MFSYPQLNFDNYIANENEAAELSDFVAKNIFDMGAPFGGLQPTISNASAFSNFDLLGKRKRSQDFLGIDGDLLNLQMESISCLSPRFL